MKNTMRYFQPNKAAALKPIIIACSLMTSPLSLAFSNNYNIDPEDRSGNWSIGFIFNWQESPYAGEDYRSDFMPQFIYTGEKLYFDTTELGWHAWDTDQWQLDLYTHYFIGGYNDHTFFSDTGEVRDEDDPLKGMERKNAFEAGAELTRKTDWGRWSVDINHDIDGVHNGGGARLGWSKTWQEGNWQLEPWAKLNWYSAEKSDYYFGVTEAEALDDRPAYRLSDTTSMSAGAAVRYTAWKQHHFSFNLGYTHFNDAINDSPIVVDNDVFNTSISYRYELNDLAYNPDGGYNFFTNNPNPWSLRLAYGCATDSSFNKIVRFDINCDGDGTHLASVFASRQLSKTLFTLPIEAWITTGVARRFEEPHQDNFWEGVLAFTAIFRQFPWSEHVDTRLGLAEGLSYAGSVPNNEVVKAEEKDRRTSHLLNYLDYSIDVSIGDIFKIKKAEHCYFGFSVHHRSGIFGSANLYGNVYGGSNMNTLYIECEFHP